MHIDRPVVLEIENFLSRLRRLGFYLLVESMELCVEVTAMSTPLRQGATRFLDQFRLPPPVLLLNAPTKRTKPNRTPTHDGSQSLNREICFLSHRPPALHFYAKRRASDRNASAATNRASITAVADPAAAYNMITGAADGGAGSGVGSRGDVVEEAQEERREDLDQVVYYYDVATAWIRPFDLKVSFVPGRAVSYHLVSLSRVILFV